MADYTDLIARLEKATAPTRPLFEESYLAAHGKPCWDDGDDGYFFNECLGIGAWESAALVLVPEGWSFRLWRHPGEHGCHCDVYLLGEFKDGERPCLAAEDAEQCPTPALALVIAALKARQAGG